MKTQLRNQISKITLGLGIVFLAACQNKPLTIGQTKFQTEGTRRLTSLTDQYSKAFTSKKSTSSRGITGFEDYGFGGAQSSQNFAFEPKMDMAAKQCAQIAKGFPATPEAYAPSMVTLARCLNRLVQEGSYMMTAMQQQAAPGQQRMWAYGMNYGQPAPYSQFSDQNYQMLMQFMQQGFAQ